MFENIKTDIIYFKSNTDFELEFNLCGCCKMRLLTTKAPDKKTFVHSLARAISRSQVAIVIGSLFSEEGIINLTTNAIGSSLVTVDNSEYGIEANQNIQIIKDSLPLVTPEGYFGGCIIESGPQTIILLTENKNIRKTIMHNLIHPYFQELYINNDTDNKKSIENNEVKIEDEAEIQTETEIDTETKADTETEVQTPSTPPVMKLVLDDTTPKIVAEETEISEDEAEVSENSADLNNEETKISQEDIKEPVKEEVPEQTSSEETKAKYDDKSDSDEDFFFFGGADDANENIAKEFSPIPTAYTSYSPRKNGIFSAVGEIVENNAFTVDDDEDDYDTDTNIYSDTSESVKPSEFQEDSKPSKLKKKRGLKVPMIILMVIIVLAAALLCYYFFFGSSDNGTTMTDSLQEIIDTFLG